MNTNQEFIEYVLYIAHKCPWITLTKLYKLLWFASIEYADLYGGILVKDVFMKKQFWPVPELGKDYIDSVRGAYWQKDENIQITSKIVNGYEHICIEPLRAYDSEYFTEYDISVLDAIIAKYGKERATDLSKLSHDTAWDTARMHGKVDITLDMKESKYKPIVEGLYDDITLLAQAVKYA